MAGHGTASTAGFILAFLGFASFASLTSLATLRPLVDHWSTTGDFSVGWRWKPCQKMQKTYQ
jgi:hypothetical protein